MKTPNELSSLESVINDLLNENRSEAVTIIEVIIVIKGKKGKKDSEKKGK